MCVCASVDVRELGNINLQAYFYDSPIRLRLIELVFLINKCGFLESPIWNRIISDLKKSIEALNGQKVLVNFCYMTTRARVAFK